ncbi:putative bifunctional diguanylate cyclase/phosphodiesterase [Pleomorphomonas oryzae]|uniref:putative bifunctional diguanylate cyclase/phosphodiesterase n=1 Tax=Pleomorphomonas oryzae TaxID=261934 RepID=UPI000403CAD5|nr:EAL domain-containing protein [Pleomorphomonas oryzae]
MFALLVLQIAAFSVFPLYFTTLSGPIRQVHFYVYISLVLLIGGFMGNVYSLPVADGIVVSGGNLCYGAFMMTSVMFVWVERNAFILRHLVRLVFVVDLFNIAFSFLTQSVLETKGVINPHGVPTGMFEVSTFLIALGGVLIVSELLILLYIFEFTKKRKPALAITATIYILSFVLVLVLDGIAFPFIAFGINAQIAAIVFGGLSGKVLIAAAFGVPLGLFILWQRKAFVDYLETDTVRWRLLVSSSAQLIREMAKKDQDVRRGDIVFKNSTEGLAIVGPTGAMLKANAAFQRMLGIGEAGEPSLVSLSEAFWWDGKPVPLPQNSKEMWRREVMFGKDRNRPGILSITPAGEDTEGGETYVYSLIDITEQKNTQERLGYLASRDQLTGLANRRILDQRLAELKDTPFVLIIVDLDHFKDVNDSYGHGAGDRVLQVVANRLDAIRQEHLKPDDILCRIGGDEFAFLIRSEDGFFIESTLEKIQTTLGQTVRIDDSLEVFSSATLGVSYKLGAGGQDALLEADAALYEAKRNRRGSVGVYEDRLTAESQKKIKLGVKLKNALANNVLQVHYQPQFDAVSHKLCGVEALARWTDPELGVVPPSDFIPVAEGTSLIEAVGEYVLERACRDGQDWLQGGYAPITVSVNISASQVRFGSFISMLSKTLSKTGFPARNLQIEITESSYIERENEVTPLLKELKDMGVSIAIDDFGTGYSSFSYLREMPWDCIKIDRSFITGIPTDTQQCGLVSTIIGLAKVMSFDVVAEGVETREQLNFLAALGCDLIQGYYFSKALPKESLVSLLPLRDESLAL